MTAPPPAWRNDEERRLAQSARACTPARCLRYRREFRRRLPGINKGGREKVGGKPRGGRGDANRAAIGRGRARRAAAEGIFSHMGIFYLSLLSVGMGRLLPLLRAGTALLARIARRHRAPLHRVAASPPPTSPPRAMAPYKTPAARSCACYLAHGSTRARSGAIVCCWQESLGPVCLYDKHYALSLRTLTLGSNK